jgi:hypothetical protein
MEEWLGPDRLADRIAHLTIGGGRNGDVLLNASTVWGDGVANTLSGGSGGDLVFLAPPDTASGAGSVLPVKQKS